MLLLREGLLLLYADRRRNPQTLPLELARLLLQAVLHLAALQHAAFELCLVEDLGFGAGLGEEGGEDGVLPDLGKSDTFLLVDAEDLLEQVFDLIRAINCIFSFGIGHGLFVAELLGLLAELLALVLERPVGVDFCIGGVVPKG
jgi:hypothetical protein